MILGISSRQAYCVIDPHDSRENMANMPCEALRRPYRLNRMWVQPSTMHTSMAEELRCESVHGFAHMAVINTEA